MIYFAHASPYRQGPLCTSESSATFLGLAIEMISYNSLGETDMEGLRPFLPLPCSVVSAGIGATDGEDVKVEDSSNAVGMGTSAAFSAAAFCLLSFRLIIRQVIFSILAPLGRPALAFA